MLEVKVSDIMTEHVVTVKTTCDVHTAVHMFLRYRISGVPVVDSKKKVVGVLNVDSVISALNTALKKDNDVAAVFRGLSKLKVTKIMRKDFVTAEKNDCMIELFKKAHDKNLMTVPVVDNGHICGIVGLRDVLNIAMHEDIDLND